MWRRAARTCLLLVEILLSIGHVLSGEGTPVTQAVCDHLLEIGVLLVAEVLKLNHSRRQAARDAALNLEVVRQLCVVFQQPLVLFSQLIVISSVAYDIDCGADDNGSASSNLLLVLSDELNGLGCTLLNDGGNSLCLFADDLR